METKTIGEQRVRVEFNPERISYVDEIKQKTAELINLINNSMHKPSLSDEEIREFLRLKELAMTSYEEAAMWAVKSATF
ncbi:MAG TPA: hypothetical protein VIK77_00325 [Tissierellaceae bacterium]